MPQSYKKMAGTSAVFLLESHQSSSPVERDGMVWQPEELHLHEVPKNLTPKPAMANALALEGLEDYDPASNGDIRQVQSLNSKFMYLEHIKGWIEIE